MEVVHEKEKQEWAYHGALPNTTAYWSDSQELSSDVYPQVPFRKVCFNPPVDDITLAERLHFRQKKSVVNGVKGLNKIKVERINCVTFIHHAHHRFFEDQQIGETGPMWWETMLMRWD